MKCTSTTPTTERDLLYRKRRCRWQGIYKFDVEHDTFQCLVYLDRGVMTQCEYKGDEGWCKHPAKGELL